MAARHYAQFLDASDPDQSADDDFRLGTTPAEILRGNFRIGYIPREDSSYASARYLLSVDTVGGHLGFLVEPDGSDSAVAIYLDGVLLVSHGPLTFDAGQELTIVFGAAVGTITVAGALTGDGQSDGFAWNVVGGAMRLGGNIDGADLARGYVSLPYAVVGAVLGVEGGGGTSGSGMLNFSDEGNSALLGLL